MFLILRVLAPPTFFEPFLPESGTLGTAFAQPVFRDRGPDVQTVRDVQTDDNEEQAKEIADSLLPPNVCTAFAAWLSGLTPPRLVCQIS